MDDLQPTPDDLEQVLLGYFDAVDRGHAVSPEQMVKKHPHLASLLKEFFSGQQVLSPLGTPNASDDMETGTGAYSTSQQDREDTQPDIPPWTPLGELGRGGIGVVYNYHDPQLERRLAVKVLRSKFTSDEDARRRFIEEAQICAQLQHPGIVPIHIRGALHDGRPYFAMKLIRGETMANLLSRRCQPLEDLSRFIAVFDQICQTVAFAHAHQIIHRDLKPSNIMVGLFSEVQVMDWGLAKVLSRSEANAAGKPDLPDAPTIQTIRTNDEAAHTHAGRAFGTPAYMPPEQATGQVEDLDERCDVFALGAILCEILTGYPPYRGVGMNLLQQVRTGDLTDAHARLDACSADKPLIDLARQCLSVDKSDRPASAKEVARLLGEYQDQLSQRLRESELDRAAVTAREAEAVLTLKAERKARTRTLALAAALIGLIVIGCGIGWYLEKQRMERAAEQATRVTAIERDISVELNETRLFIDQGWKLKTKPEEWKNDLRSARLAFDRAARRTEEENLSEDIQQRVQSVKHALEKAEKAHQLVRSYERGRMALADSSGGAWNLKKVSNDYHQAFKAFGLDISSPNAVAIATQLRDHPLREQVLDMLEEWNLFLQDAESKKQIENVIAAIDVSASSFRKRIREAISRHDMDSLLIMVRSKEARQLSPPAMSTLITVVHYMGISETLLAISEKNTDRRLRGSHEIPTHFLGREDCLALLRDGIRQYPDEFWLRTLLLFMLDAKQPTERQEMLGHAMAVVALRPKNAFTQHSLGLVLENAGDIHSAAQAFQKAVELDGDELRAKVSLSIVLLKLNRIDEAIQLDRELVKVVPKDARIHQNLGCALMAKGEKHEGVKVLLKARELDPSNWQIQSSLAIALMDINDRPGAKAAFERALQLNPANANACCLLGRLFREEHQLTKAVMLYQTAIKLSSQLSSPKLAEVYHELGLVYAMSQDNINARKYLQLAIVTDPNNQLIQAHLKRVDIEKPENKKEAVKLLEETARKYPTNERVLLDLADAYSDAGMLDEAIKTYQHCVGVSPRNVVPLVKLGVSHFLKNNIDQAEKYLSNAIEIDAKYGPAHIYLAKVLLRKKRMPDALLAIRAGLAILPDHIDAVVTLGECLMLIGDHSRALEAYRKAVSIRGNDPDLRCHLGKLLWYQRDFPNALIHYKKAVELNPKNIEGLLGLSVIHAEMQNINAAVETLEKVLQLEKNPKALQVLSQLLLSNGQWKKAAQALKDYLEIESTLPIQLTRADCLRTIGDVEGAIAASREAIRLAPKQPFAYYSLGISLVAANRNSEAIEALRKAVKLGPTASALRFALGGALHSAGGFADAMEEFRLAKHYCLPTDGRQVLYEKQIQYVNRVLKLQPKLADLIKSKELLPDAEDLLALADLCRKGTQRYHVAAVRFSEGSAAINSTLFNDTSAGHRCLAAASAVQAAAGNGADARTLEAKERTALRKKAFQWLKTDLEQFKRTKESTPRPQRMPLWMGIHQLRLHPDFEPVRDPKSRLKLPKAEQQEWAIYWDQVDALFKQMLAES